MWDLTDASLLPSTVAPRQCRDSGWSQSQSQSQVIVGGTLIRRSPLDGVTDIHMKPALRGMTLVKIPVLVSSLVCN